MQKTDINSALTRLVQKIEPADKNDQPQSLVPFLDYLQSPNMILLGDPGSGKTHTFKAAASEENASYLSVREFLATEESEWPGGTVYLDGLDEFRSRIGDKNAIFEVIKLLKRSNRPRLRLSCRIADWLGETDLSLFRKYFRENPFVVLNLEPLNRKEIKAILASKNILDLEEFVREAEKHGLDGLLGNPQTLIMLAEVVGSGGWPSTKLQLYERSVRLLLSEPNRERSRDNLGKYTSEELVASAGAACASILISGVAGLSLVSDESVPDFPSYRSLPFEDPERMLACLLRRAFSGAGKETVSYVHRTVAEFLAAKWISDQVRNGLPLRRVQSLIGVEGHPAPELRGLHAWLAILLPEYASVLLAYDPYGVLIYSDAASLSISDRQSLFLALVALSKTDPWFRSGNWSEGPIGALSSPDMVIPFRQILSDPGSGFHLRSLVLDAIKNGPDLPEMREDLGQILTNRAVAHHERVDALHALLRVVPGGHLKVVEIYRSSLSKEPSSARLRAKVLEKLYADNFGPSDVISMFRDYCIDVEEHATGDILGFESSILEKDLPIIMDQFSELLQQKECGDHRANRRELEVVFLGMLSRILTLKDGHPPARLWHWFKALGKDRPTWSSGLEKTISQWLSENESSVFQLFDVAYDELDLEKERWDFIQNFQKATLRVVDNKNLASHILDVLKNKTGFSAKDVFLYEACGLLVFSSKPASYELFERFFRFGEDHESLENARDEVCLSRLHDWHIKNAKEHIKHKRKQLERTERNRTNLKKTSEKIRSGEHLHNLGFLAEVYFGMFSNQGAELSPVERLRAEIGEELVIDALNGFSMIIGRTDLPTPTDIVSSSVIYRWWYAFLAGMEQEWIKHKSLSHLSDTILRSALAIVMEHPPRRNGISIETKDIEWCQSLFSGRSDLIQGVFEEMARANLKTRINHLGILYYLYHDDQTADWRGAVAFKLLNEYPTANADKLLYLMFSALWDASCHAALVEYARFIARTSMCGKEEQRAVWLSLGFLLDHEFFRPLFEGFAKSHPWVLWTLRDVIGRGRTRYSSNYLELAIDQLEVLIRIFGVKLKNVSHPRGGWSGSQNPWDASELIRKAIDSLSAFPEPEASGALKSLSVDDKLSSYYDHLMHAVEMQAAVRREKEYRQPTWSDVTKTLSGGAPANMADLHALTLDHLDTLKKTIAHSNTDTYKAFWRCDSYGRVDLPEIEEICRDRLIELMKPRILSLGLRIEPEGHMSTDKRADIVLLPPPGQKLPLELKRDVHPDLWDACVSQLDRLYARDPEAAGYGIYVVFWFGGRRAGNIPNPPTGIGMPKSATEMETALRSLIPNEKHYGLEVIVVDVSPPGMPE